MKPQRQEKRLMGDDPLAGDNILERFYKPEPSPVTPIKAAKPTHYKVVCISLYNEDIENLESLVAELKRRGHTKANKSQLIRAALAQVDLGKIPKGF
ncbi:MAG: hypothetical protein JWN44_186 [Myxococcales bacterium]|nr:hypothetical protein [Myxococcales bacterium]